MRKDDTGTITIGDLITPCIVIIGGIWWLSIVVGRYREQNGFGQDSNDSDGLVLDIADSTERNNGDEMDYSNSASA